MIHDTRTPENNSIHICVWSKVDGVLLGDIPGYFYSMLVHFVHLETGGGMAGFLHRLYRENHPYICKSWGLAVKLKAAKRELAVQDNGNSLFLIRLCL